MRRCGLSGISARAQRQARHLRGVRAQAKVPVVRRDPRTDPQEGDVLLEMGGDRQIVVDMVRGDEVFYRVVRGPALLNAVRKPIAEWREQAPDGCLLCSANDTGEATDEKPPSQ